MNDTRARLLEAMLAGAGDGAGPDAIIRAELEAALVEAGIVGAWDWDLTTDRVGADRGIADLFGLPAVSQLPVQAFVDVVHPLDRADLDMALAAAIRGDAPLDVELRLIRPGRGPRVVRVRGRRVADGGAAATRLIGVLVDVTEPRAAAAAQRHRDERYRRLFETIETGFAIIRVLFDGEGRPADYVFIEVNAAFPRHTGFEPMPGQSVRQLLPDLEQAWYDIYGRVASTGEPARFENFAAPLGNRWFDVHAFRVGDPEERLVGILFTDITERRRIETVLRANEEQFRIFAQAMPNHVWTARPDGGLDWLNDRALAYAGLPLGEVAALGWAGLAHDADRGGAENEWRRALVSGSVFTAEIRLRRRDGAYRWHLSRAVPLADDDGTITRWIGTNTDIDDQKSVQGVLAGMNARLSDRVEERSRELFQTQAALRQSQKMEAIGNLAGGIAHDFNNLLQVISGNLQLALRDAPPGATMLAQRLANAEAGVARGARLASQLLAFSRRQPLEPRVVNLGRLIRDMDQILRRSLGEAVEIESIIGGDLWNTLVDPNNVENALLNLAINARDAMDGHGRLVIEAGNATLDEAACEALGDILPGQYVMIAVTDTGTGMPTEVMEKVFDPFFTTKPAGKGSGLGLSMVYGFVRQSGGHIHIETEVGRGTTFRIHLPRSVLAEDVPVEAEPGPISGGNECILVAEDDEAVRETTVGLLTDLGYRVLKARDADGALAIIESGVAIDLLFTDVVMPGKLKSTELAQLARERLPHVAVLFTSGYSEDSIVHGGRLDPGVNLLSKPYSRETLARRLRALLGPAADPPAEVAAAGGGAAIDPLRGRTLLVCEDDVFIRMDIAEILRGFGAIVVEAGDGAAALERVAAGGIDALITDVGLPDRSGVDIAIEARRLYPGLPVVFASGRAVLPEADGIAGAVMLSKPFGEKDLRRAVTTALA